MINTVLAVDPGRSKCGIAIVSRNDGVMVRTIVCPADVSDTIRLLFARYEPDAIIVGAGTGSEAVIKIVNQLPIKVHLIDERLSTQIARSRYFKDNPPKGWRRLIPLSMQVPPCPYDDYAAVVLAERFLKSQVQKDPAANL